MAYLIDLHDEYPEVGVPRIEVESEIQVGSEVVGDSNWRPDPPEFKVEVYSEVKAGSEFKGEVYPEVKVVSEFKSEIFPEVKVGSEFKGEVAAEVKARECEFSFLLAVDDSNVYRRSSSLKASLTPPGTAHHQRKAVRFADALGLDLESVRHVLNTTEPPIVPSSATRDLIFNLDRNDSGATLQGEVPRLRAWFADPSTSPDFERQVLERKVRLGKCTLDSVDMTVTGIVWVSNFSYEKAVTVRYTTNAWVTFDDVEATFVSGSGSKDYFRFVVELGDYFSVGSKMEFSVRLSCDDETFWDSNDGGNYRVECCADKSC